MVTAVLLGFLYALCLVFFGKFLKGRASVLSTLVPGGIFVYFAGFIPRISAGETVTQVYEWVPSLGANLTFHLDGLSLIFVLMISGIGALVFLYTSYYLKGDVYLDRFYGYLAMFMAAMLGLVLSDNVISLFVFWELTSITSFFLIGYKNKDAGSRKAAMIALAVTGIGGMLLFAGLLIMAAVSNTFSIQEMINSGVPFPDADWYLVILFLILGGAFTKSAQFPFHFWLPGAMKAPTPVSTYLHSATMVKAGIYILMRFTPALGNTPEWNNTLMIVGGITMLYAAFHTLFRTDLKSILAYSTIAALGILVFLIGIGTEAALIAASVYILVHALYKATLFLITGIIDHETGTRDVTKLRGLGKVMIPVAIAGFLAALSNAGMPPFFGFIGKDLIYEASLRATDMNVWLTAAAVITNILLLYAGYLVGIKPFLGKPSPDFAEAGMPHPLLWTPPFLLAIGCLLFGIFPGMVENALIRPAISAMGAVGFEFHLMLWHGFNTVLLLSAGTLVSGAVLCYFLRPSSRMEAGITKLEWVAPISLFERFYAAFTNFAYYWTRFFQNDYLRYYILTIMTFLVILIGYNLLTGVHLYIDFHSLKEVTIYEMAILGIMVVAIGYTVFTQSRLAAVASMGVVGYAICLIFVFYSAPDLAMTQFAIDTLTVILFVLVLYRLPKYLKLSEMRSRIRDGALAITFGLLITLLALEVLSEPVNRETTEFYASNAYLMAKGKNVVNVILVDFRGIDTFVEISVLVIAAVGVFGLLKLRLKKSEIE